MNWEQNRWLHRARRWPDHMQALAGQLGELAGRVRESVSELVGESVGTAVRDLIQRAWHQQPALRARPPVEPSGSYRRDWQRRPDVEAWMEDEIEHGEWTEPSSTAAAAPSSQTVSRPALLALAMQAAGWWLRQRGSWLAALGLGCIVGGLAFLGGPMALAGLNLLEAAGDVYSLNELLSTSPDILIKA